MPIRNSHDKARPENWRIDKLPPPVETEDAGPDRDPNTGRFTRQNQAAKRRKIVQQARALAGLDPSKVAPWLRPSVELAVSHATDLIASLPVQTVALNQLAIDAATSTSVYRGLLALGAAGDREALSEARQWLKESRQTIIALTGLSRQEAEARSGGRQGTFATLVIESTGEPDANENGQGTFVIVTGGGEPLPADVRPLPLDGPSEPPEWRQGFYQDADGNWRSNGQDNQDNQSNNHDSQRKRKGKIKQ